MACPIFDFPINKMMACVVEKKNFENSLLQYRVLSYKVPAHSSCSNGCKLSTRLSSHARGYEKDTPHDTGLISQFIIEFAHRKSCSASITLYHNVLLFEALMSNFLFLQSMNKVKYKQESTHHFIVLHNMSFDG